MSVNVSPTQSVQPGYVRGLEDTLAANGLLGYDLELEITERTILYDPKALIEVLKQLRKLGVRIAIDDFGTGHSSLNYLKDLPLDSIKIDRSFITDLSRTDNRTSSATISYAAALVRAIASVAEILGLELVAEGIETRETELIAKQLGCQLGQGYFFSRPISESRLRALFKTSEPEVLSADLVSAA